MTDYLNNDNTMKSEYRLVDVLYGSVAAEYRGDYAGFDVYVIDRNADDEFFEDPYDPYQEPAVIDNTQNPKEDSYESLFTSKKHEYLDKIEEYTNSSSEDYVDDSADLFLDEIPEDCVVHKGGYRARPEQNSFGFGNYGSSFGNYPQYQRQQETLRYTIPTSQPKQPATYLELNKGDMVLHAAFGKGMVLSVMKMGGDALLEIAFDDIGTKKLMAKTASAAPQVLNAIRAEDPAPLSMKTTWVFNMVNTSSHTAFCFCSMFG